MEVLSAYITDLLVENEFVSKDKIEVCKYGIENLIATFLEIISVLVLAILFKNVIYTLIFLASLISLRRYTGGYHANTKKGCYIVFVAVYLIYSVLLRYIPEKHSVILGAITIFFTLIMVLCYAPIVHHNKKVSESERKIYRRFAIIITSALSAFIVLGMIVNLHSKIILSVIAGLLVVSVSMLASLPSIRR